VVTSPTKWKIGVPSRVLVFCLFVAGCGGQRTSQTSGRSSSAEAQVPAASEDSATPNIRLPDGRADEALRTAVHDDLRIEIEQRLSKILNPEGKDRLQFKVYSVRSCGREFTVAEVTRAVNTRIGGPTGPTFDVQSKAVVVFDVNGKLLKQIGGDIAADGMNGDRAQVLTFGTTSAWFIWLRQHEPQGPFVTLSRVYLLKDGVQPAVCVRHYRSDDAYTTTKEMTRHYGPFFSFRGKDRQLKDTMVGKGADGGEYNSLLVWDSAKFVFRGASRIVFKEVPIYEVDLDKSQAFEATDFPAHVPND
jgi:hypothetical protein